MRYILFTITLLPIFLFHSFVNSFYNHINDVNEHLSSYTQNILKLQANTNHTEKQPITLRLSSEDQSLDSFSQSQKKKPAKTPRPTPIPLLIPPPADENSSNIIILLGVLSILIVIIGVWINRYRLE